MAIISALLLAWFLSLFNLDEILIQGINEVLNTSFNTSVYWLAFFLVGAIIEIVQAVKRK